MRAFAARSWQRLDRVGVPARWVAVLGWAALIFMLSGQPGLRVSSDPGVDGPTRHIAHVIAYGLLTLLTGWALAGRHWPTVRVALAAAILALLYGVTDEWHQTFVPSRSGRPEDLLWDGLGALAGFILLSIVARGRAPTDG